MLEVKLLIIILLVMEVIDVGNLTLSKAAMAEGMSNYVYTTYTHAISLLFLIPVAFLYHRKTPPPPIRCSIILRIFLLGILNCACSIFLYTGIRYSSPTLASAMNNLSPAFTFILAVIFRMEILSLSAQSSILKLVGTIVSISGALVVIFYQGLPIILFSSPIKTSFDHVIEHHQAQPNWIVGGIFLSMSSIVISLSYITKTWIVRDFPSEVLIILITFFFESIVAAIATSIAENDASVWRPNIGIQWISILVGAVAASLVNIVDTWACRVKGPVFVAMFKPLQMIIAVIMGVSFLGDVLHLGSVIGGFIIAFGFYTVMKGNAEEEMVNKDDENRLAYIIDEDEEEEHPLKIPILYDKA